MSFLAGIIVGMGIGVSITVFIVWILTPSFIEENGSNREVYRWR